MLDNMIADGDIEPLIVVTPTFYVEDDCADDLDQLTYSFAKELRNDLMPEIESSYSTYAKSADDKGIFQEPGSQSLCWFVKRGGNDVPFRIVPEPGLVFPGLGHSAEAGQIRLHLKTPFRQANFAELPIHYLYVASGNLDFALPGQVQDYQALLDIEPRLLGRSEYLL